MESLLHNYSFVTFVPPIHSKVDTIYKAKKKNMCVSGIPTNPNYIIDET
jgi:hypothetical protein